DQLDQLDQQDQSDQSFTPWPGKARQRQTTSG
ncbi:MAG: hypothetical protein US70_C0025G0001, partial [Parcubacteria group bacterium GW2011_GWD2_38_11]